MWSQKGFIKVVKLKDWTPIQTRKQLDIAQGRAWNIYTFKECPAIECRVSLSNVKEFKEAIANQNEGNGGK